jgi:hypothetical protein
MKAEIFASGDKYLIRLTPQELSESRTLVELQQNANDDNVTLGFTHHLTLELTIPRRKELVTTIVSHKE